MIEEQSKRRSRSKVIDDSRLFFGATNVSLRYVADVGIFMMSLVLRCRNDHDNELPQSRHVFFGGINDELRVVSGHSVLSRDPSSVL